MTYFYPHFSKEEMECRCGCKGLPKPEFMERLEGIREEYADILVITSGFRCVEYNREVSETGDNSPHSMGLAADIRIRGSAAFNLIGIAMKHGMTGIGVSQKGDWLKRFIHLDCVPPQDFKHPRPTIWSY